MGMVRYDGPGFNQDMGGDFAATALGVQGFRGVRHRTRSTTTTFSGNAADINRWAGTRPIARWRMDICWWTTWSGRRGNIPSPSEARLRGCNTTTHRTVQEVNPLQLTFANTATGGYNAEPPRSIEYGTGVCELSGGSCDGREPTSRFPQCRRRWPLPSDLTLHSGQLEGDFAPDAGHRSALGLLPVIPGESGPLFVLRCEQDESAYG